MDTILSPNSTILWADDDADDMMLMQEVLKDTDKRYSIVEVHNGRQALDYLKQCKKYPCLIILDMNMPVMNGQETLSSIKNNEQYKNIPLVVFTTSSSALDREFCKRFSVDMITKPAEYKSFHNMIFTLLSYCG